MGATTLCEQCNQWVPLRDTALCLDCQGLVCAACRGAHTARRVGDDTYLTCRPHTDEDVRRLVEGED